MAHSINRIHQLTQFLHSSPKSLAVILFAQENNVNSDVRAEMQNSLKQFQRLASEMSTYDSNRPVNFYVNYLYSSGDNGDIQEFCGASSVPFVAICSPNGVIKTWPRLDEKKLTQQVLSHLRT